MLQARITNDLRGRLERAAKESGKSLSQEAQVRLAESFDLPAEMQRAWGPPEVKALAQLVSRVARCVQSAVGASTFDPAGDLAWHRDAFTHAAVSAAVNAIFAHYKPTGAVEPPASVLRRAEWVAPDQAAAVTSPESVGLSCALGLLDQMAIVEKPSKVGPNEHYGDNYYVLPDIRKILGDRHEQ